MTDELPLPPLPPLPDYPPPMLPCLCVRGHPDDLTDDPHPLSRVPHNHMEVEFEGMRYQLQVYIH
jgi:hypothetical protein